jgi:hypothetical protein
MDNPRRLLDQLQEALRAVRFATADDVADAAVSRFARVAIEFEHADDAARSWVAAKLPTKAASILLALSARSALEAVAARDPKYVRAALMALIIANFSGDLQEIRRVLSVIWFGARALGLNPTDLFSSVVPLCSPSGRSTLHAFMAKSDSDKVALMNDLGSDNEEPRVGFSSSSFARSRHRYN